MSSTEALQATLAAEHAAIYLYGVLGARTSQSASPALYAALTAAHRRHRSRRDQLRMFLQDHGAEPVAAESIYEVPSSWAGPVQISAAALRLEQSSTEDLTAVVAQTALRVRRWALTEVVWSATAELDFGGAASTWPGAPELG